MNVYRETLQQNKILRVIKMNLAKKYLEMHAETAEKEDLEDDTAKHSSPRETAVPNSVNEGHPDKI